MRQICRWESETRPNRDFVVRNRECEPSKGKTGRGCRKSGVSPIRCTRCSPPVRPPRYNGSNSRWSCRLNQGGGAKKIRGITVFSYPSPLGGVRPEKNIPPLCIKKFRNPNFFLKNTTSCFFILCKRSLHNALRTPNIPYFAGTNLDPYISLSAQISATTKRGC